MNQGDSAPSAAASPRAAAVLHEMLHRIHRRWDRLFAALLIFQWIAGVACAWVITPRTWIGATATVNAHVWASLILGALLASLPLYLIRHRPGRPVTRHTIAAAQMLFAALLIHLTGGRIETHFHIFGSLAMLAMYRDWRVLLTASVVITLDHALRDLFWSQSVFGVVNANDWRWLEHAAWVAFEDVVLVAACVHSRRELALIAAREAEVVETGQHQNQRLTLALAERNDLLAALDSGAIIATTDARGRITSVNDRFCEISGYRRDELVGQDHRIINSGYHEKSFWTGMYKVVAAGGVWRGEIRNRAKNGRLYWVDTTIKGILGPDGKLQRIVAVRADITDRKLAEVQLQQAQRLESIGQLAAGIAHEINTPAQYVGDNVRFLQAQFDNLMRVADRYAAQLNTPVAQSWAERRAATDLFLREADFDFLRREIPAAINQSIEGLDRVTSIVRAMKDFSHPGTDRKQPADLNRAIASTVEVCRNRWKYIADVELDLALDLPPVPCLMAEFNQVILNLVVNAADALAERPDAERAQKGQIVISSRQTDDDWVEVRVRDNGPGIPSRVRDRVFDPFFTTKPIGRGTGQGLPLSRNVIVNKHGGHLSFETEEGRGTTFVIRLPLEAADEQPSPTDTSTADAALSDVSTPQQEAA